jgi:hypothetical protein
LDLSDYFNVQSESNISYHSLVFIAIMAWSSLAACAAQVTEVEDCSLWLDETNTLVGSVPVPDRYQKTLELLATGCEIIPQSLKEAARQSLKSPSIEQAAILGRAAAPYFASACASEEFSMPASKLLHICLGSDFPHGEFGSMLSKIDAASYLYGKALQQEFINSGVYDQHGKRILLNFFLSNAVLRESE